MKQSKIAAIVTAGAISACLFSSATGAQAAPTVWEGIAFITSANSAESCASGGVGVGGSYVIVYRPILADISQNGPEGLSFTSGRSSDLFEPTSATATFRGAGAFNSIAIHSYAYAMSNTGTYDMAINPASITSTTEFVLFSGILENFFDVAGCTIHFKAALARRT